MKLLFISPYLLEKNMYGGMRRCERLIRFLSERHQVYVICFDTRAQDMQPAEFHDSIPITVLPRPRHLFFTKAFNQLFRLTPSYVLNCFSKAMAHSITAFCEKEQIDVIHIEYTYMGNYINYVNRPATAAVLVDQELNFRKFWRDIKLNLGSVANIYRYIYYLKLRRYEATIANRFDRVFTITAEEKKALSRYAKKAAIEIFPHVVDEIYFKPSAQIKTDNSNLVFTGNFAHKPNISGILWFLKYIYPAIRNKQPNVTLTIVGANPPLAIKSFHQQHNITVTGLVSDIRPYLEKAGIFINPVINGGGMRGKVLEAMAMEKAIVSTRIGAEGFPVSHQGSMMIALTKESFITNTLTLLNQPDLQQNLGKNNRKLIEKHYTETIIFKQMEKNYQHLMAEKLNRINQ
jgi:glycosyltransferase involved in cell wall biosynthesis